MKSLGIDLLSVSTFGGLDSWEIPKDRVVINRKLGEGAFGTVYGGEAYFNEKGWVSSALGINFLLIQHRKDTVRPQFYSIKPFYLFHASRSLAL